MNDTASRVVRLYDDQADAWIADRGQALGGDWKSVDEIAALERLASALWPGARILDVGCGSGWPWGAALLHRGFDVTGVDASSRLIAHARRTLPSGDWRVEDMRTLDLGQTFDAILIWYSLFHLTPQDQGLALGRILTHAAPTSLVLMTDCGPPGVQIGEWRGEPLYHASLGPSAYGEILEAAGFSLRHPEADGSLAAAAEAPIYQRDGRPPN